MLFLRCWLVNQLGWCFCKTGFRAGCPVIYCLSWLPKRPSVAACFKSVSNSLKYWLPSLSPTLYFFLPVWFWAIWQWVAHAVIRQQFALVRQWLGSLLFCCRCIFDTGYMDFVYQNSRNRRKFCAYYLVFRKYKFADARHPTHNLSLRPNERIITGLSP